MLPPLRVIATRTSDAARLRLSVRHSIRTATPPGAYPSYMIVWYSAPPASAPDPRLTARSMLSLGTELFRALTIASYSVGLASGSPPPVRAATSMFLISLAKSLPRRASTTAFLCLVVAHFEWPLMSDPSPCLQTAGGRARHPSARGGRRWRAAAPAGPRRSYRWPDRSPEPPPARRSPPPRERG